MKLLKQETDVFASNLSIQLKTISYINGLFGKSSSLVFEEPDDCISCIDMSRDGNYTALFKRKEFAIKENNRQSDDSGEGKFDSDLNIFVSLKFDYFSKLWTMDDKGSTFLLTLHETKIRKDQMSLVQKADEPIANSKRGLRSIRQDDKNFSR